MSNVSVPVMSDSILEGNEEFNLTLNIPPSVGRGIETGSVNNAVGVIVDSTSKCSYLLMTIQYPDIYS